MQRDEPFRMALRTPLSFASAGTELESLVGRNPVHKMHAPRACLTHGVSRWSTRVTCHEAMLLAISEELLLQAEYKVFGILISSISLLPAVNARPSTCYGQRFQHWFRYTLRFWGCYSNLQLDYPNCLGPRLFIDIL
jgi:hypothetical protein